MDFISTLEGFRVVVLICVIELEVERLEGLLARAWEVVGDRRELERVQVEARYPGWFEGAAGGS